MVTPIFSSKDQRKQLRNISGVSELVGFNVPPDTV